jgi:uncharacterized membrane protein
MNQRADDAAPLVAMGVLLATSVVLHALHLVNGYAAFWVPVTATMTVFCLLSSTTLIGWSSTLAFLGIGVSFGMFFEALSIKTGFPFGPYYYSDVFGPKVLNVPLIIPFAWYVICYLAFVLSNFMLERVPVASGGSSHPAWLALLGASIVTAYDLALDPFMIHKIGAWHMIDRGKYFGEQARGFAGWMLVSFLISVTFRFTHRRLVALEDRQAQSRRIARISTLAGFYPIAAYAMWWLFFSLFGDPQATRPTAMFAMGVPVLVAVTGLLKWRKAELERAAA